MPANIDLYYSYQFLKRLTTPFDKMEAYKLGIIDERGKLLKSPKTKEEKDAYTSFDRLVVNLKRIMAKIPGGSSQIASYGAALFLLREEHEIPLSDRELTAKLKEYMNIAKNRIGFLSEDAPTNAVGTGNIAGVDNPGVRLKHKKKKRDEPTSVLRRIITKMNEENERDAHSLTIFDVDDTLFHTFAEIKVVKDGKIIKSLNNQEYNTYKLKRGESYDFSEFRNSRKFYDTSRPIGKMVSKAKAILKKVENKPKSHVMILTARADFDEREVFVNTFHRYGININKAFIELSGNLGTGPSAQNKRVIVKRYIDKYKYSRVRMFDDAVSNLKMLLDLKKEYPDVDFEAYLVDKTGTPKRYRA